MTKKELRELIRSVIREYSGGPTDGNNLPSQRPFETTNAELDFYSNTGAPYGGDEGQQTRGMEPIRGAGNLNRTQFTKF